MRFVDLAVEGLTPNRYFEALSDLLRLFPASVDLVCVEDAVPTLVERIHREGMLL